MYYQIKALQQAVFSIEPVDAKDILYLSYNELLDNFNKCYCTIFIKLLYILKEKKILEKDVDHMLKVIDLIIFPPKRILHD